ncbi:hypothetical protein ACFOQM_01840 [Paenibacillus sp. GCM10012307]|uniref:Uncharacterized protein n=1 Tax=Paenibacillus roseus TaxID=2798579 RepID=A0A934IVG5_9BACL|nr:hypothetical protein [Paenibacillus roseus]MBJ6360061.1 hypothetical protein [Paenibacillus roseus]
MSKEEGGSDYEKKQLRETCPQQYLFSEIIVLTKKEGDGSSPSFFQKGGDPVGRSIIKD